jgi:multidrug resistance efflux pump
LAHATHHARVSACHNPGMVRKGLSVRLERHIERGEELMELNRTAFERNLAAFDRNTQAFERVMAALDRFEQTTDEQRIFIRDMNRRSEVVVQQVVRDHQEFMKGLSVRDEKADLDRAKADLDRAKADRKTDRILVELKDLREESKAQREALFALIDRLPPAQAA